MLFRSLIAMQYGAEIGMSPMQSLQSLAVINGKPTLYGDALPALVHASGLMEDYQEYFEGTGDNLTAVCKAKRKGMATPIVGTFSMADAKKAGLIGKSGPWSSYPSRMLQVRARAFCFRDGFADCLRGLAIREEVEDYSVVPSPPTPFVLPTSQPKAIEAAIESPLTEAERENVAGWHQAISMAKSPQVLLKLRNEFEELRDGKSDAEVCEIERLFSERSQTIS